MSPFLLLTFKAYQYCKHTISLCGFTRTAKVASTNVVNKLKVSTRQKALGSVVRKNVDTYRGHGD
jgi:hypothetical protein